MIQCKKVYWALLGVMLAGCGSFQEETPITTASEEARKLFVKGRDLYEKLREDEARELLSKAVELDMDFALCHYHLAECAISTIEYETHLKLAVSLASHVSDGERLIIESARALKENDHEKATALLEELVELYPRDKRAYRMLGYLYRGVDEEKAIAAYETAVKLDKNYAAAYNNLGYARRRVGDYEKAIDAFKKYAKLLPNEANPHDSIADLYKKIGRYEKAIEHYEKAVSLNSAFIFSQRKIGENLIYLERFEQAREALQGALGFESTPSAKLATLRLIAHSYVFEGKPNMALAKLDDGVEMSRAALLPEWESHFLQDKAMLLLDGGEFEGALKCLEEGRSSVILSELSSDWQEEFFNKTLYLQALTNAKAKDFKRANAITDLLESRVENSKNAADARRLQGLMGVVCAAQDLHDIAIMHFEQTNQDDPYILYHWAQCEAQYGNNDKAIPLFRKVADWNEASMEYALVRKKAQNALRSEIQSD